MKSDFRMRTMIGGTALATLLLFSATIAGSRAFAQDNSLFSTPSGRYYNPYQNGPAGSYSQGIGGPFSQGSPNMFSRGMQPMVPVGPVNLYQNQPYGGRFYFRPMAGPAYDPFRNGR